MLFALFFAIFQASRSADEDELPDEFEIVNITTSGRYQYAITDNAQQIISVFYSHFINIQGGKKDGGAFYIVNCGIFCREIEFTGCSTEGRGGAIFAHNSYQTVNYIIVTGSNISQCEGSIGGGAFVYSKNKKNNITIRNCRFSKNNATKTDKNGAYGGSGLFIAAKKGYVNENIFEENKGIGGSLQYYNKFDEVTVSSLSDNNQEKFVISNCNFIQSSSSSTSLFYSRGKGGILVELSDCTFQGDLQNGQHFIEGETLSSDSPKMIVKNCKFSESSSKAVTMESDFLSIDLKSQVFASQNANNKEKSRPSSRHAITVIAATAAIAIIAIIGILLFAKKSNTGSKDDNVIII